MKIIVIDYSIGNIKSIISAFNYLEIHNVKVSSKYTEIKSADKLILPGVGSFALAMTKIKNLELHKILDEVVIENKKPILGICLGMQLLCQNSEEDGGSEGLGYINATCKKFVLQNLKDPHVGFNEVISNKNSKLYLGLNKKNDFYFTHSYILQTKTDINQSFCEYGEKFVASFEINNIAGTQFHPELSQTNGLKLLKNFIENF